MMNGETVEDMFGRIEFLLNGPVALRKSYSKSIEQPKVV